MRNKAEKIQRRTAKGRHIISESLPAHDPYFSDTHDAAVMAADRAAEEATPREAHKAYKQDRRNRVIAAATGLMLAGGLGSF